MAYPQIPYRILCIVLTFLIAAFPGPLSVPQAHADPADGNTSESMGKNEVSAVIGEDRDVSQSATGQSVEREAGFPDADYDKPTVMGDSLEPSPQIIDGKDRQVTPEDMQAGDPVEPDQVCIMNSNLSDELNTCIHAFEEARNGYARENEALAKMQDERAVLSSSIEKFRDELEHAQSVIDAAHEELASFEGSGFRKFIMRILKPHDYESQVFLLRTLIEDRSDVIVSSGAAKSGLEHKKEELDGQMATQGELRRIALEKVNSCACKLEACCSKLHQSIKDASMHMNGDMQAASVDQQGSLGRFASSDVDIVEAESLLMKWYGETNALSGTKGGLSFGEGADFSMDQAFFVEKWGAAIDAYFEKSDGEPGVSPLKGFGRIMATSAYRYRIDPRLCAAVSVAESSGGRHCIKTCNAWGWGAADSDPYGGALSWNTWEEAIEAWHKGMAESKTGLANARTVSVLAHVYCSNPIWGATVAGVMNDISARTLPENLAR